MTLYQGLLLDTDILIDYLRNRPEAVTYLDSLDEDLEISVITAAELYAGVREGAERAKLDTFLLAFAVIPLDSAIAIRGGLLRRDYGKSHGFVHGQPSSLSLAHKQQTPYCTPHPYRFVCSSYLDSIPFFAADASLTQHRGKQADANIALVRVRNGYGDIPTLHDHMASAREWPRKA
jgi:predicted nucleic acid-binding protein